MTKKPKFSIAQIDPELFELVKASDKQALAIWAIDCVERVMPYFEEFSPNDNRPRKALETLKNWINSGEFKMSIIRGAALDSHAAAREIDEDIPARSVARAAGQAVATAHVKTHSLAAAMYCLQAIYRVSEPNLVEQKLIDERLWQYQHLIELSKS